MKSLQHLLASVVLGLGPWEDWPGWLDPYEVTRRKTASWDLYHLGWIAMSCRDGIVSSDATMINSRGGKCLSFAAESLQMIMGWEPWSSFPQFPKILGGNNKYPHFFPHPGIKDLSFFGSVSGSWKDVPKGSWRAGFWIWRGAMLPLARRCSKRQQTVQANSLFTMKKQLMCGGEKQKHHPGGRI